MSFSPFWAERNFIEFIQLLEVRDVDRGEFILFSYDPETHHVLAEYDVEADCQPDGFFVNKSREFHMTLTNYARLVEAAAAKKEITLHNGHSKLKAGVKDGEYKLEFEYHD